MKALSLLQPWATLVAIGAKRIETRSWSTDYRGPLAIHASAGFGQLGKVEYIELRLREPFRSELGSVAIPRGAVVATCELASVHRISLDDLKIPGWSWVGPDGTRYFFELTDKEKTFGDYTIGRYAWMLHNVKQLETPIPAKGKLGLWEWTGA